MRPSALGFAIGLQQYAGSHNTSLPESLSYLSNKIIRVGKVRKLIEPLKESSNVFPKVHSVWNRILEEIFNQHGSTTELIAELWANIVNPTFFSATSPERRAIAFKLVSMALSSGNEESIAIILSTDALRCFVNNHSSKDTYLHEPAQNFLKSIKEAANKSMNLRVAIVNAILTNGSVNFDRKSGSTLLADLVNELDENSIGSYVDFVTNAILAPQVSEEDIEEDDTESKLDRISAKRVWAIDALYAAVKPKPNVVISKKVAQVSIYRFMMLSFFQYDSTSVTSSGKDKEKSKKKKWKNRI